ncbi:ATP-binding response regulator [Pseudomarimonas salicorniae]|uniref:Response regulator receiver domain-containing protein n=1 Tax=Pseudomarimonas salicorniae TaxID=2933270 RepID=A0ABT0GIY3_9GAMM|nr:ATP-binding protein [Lysobacter sp. CAU 1642]MCK7594505.1 hypothetical protein [Lysobacter sp. CAU 1642]
MIAGPGLLWLALPCLGALALGLLYALLRAPGRPGGAAPLRRGLMLIAVSSAWAVFGAVLHLLLGPWALLAAVLLPAALLPLAAAAPAGAVEAVEAIADAPDQATVQREGPRPPAIEPRIEPLDAPALLHTLVAEFADTAERAGLRLALRCPPCWIRSDRVLLQRVLENLLATALAQTGYGGVLLGLRRRGSHALLQVWDTGPGRPGEAEPVPAERWRLDDGSGATRGDALRLMISASSARLLGHPLRRRSRLGRGSLHEIEVPLCDPPGSPATPDAGAAPAGRLRVLYVGAGQAGSDDCQALLQAWGHAVDAAADAEAALLSVRENRPDLLLIELGQEDGLDGFALTSILGREAGGQLPAALLARDPSAAMRARAGEQGLPLLERPLSATALQALLTAVAAHVRRPAPP